MFIFHRKLKKSAPNTCNGFFLKKYQTYDLNIKKIDFWFCDISLFWKVIESKNGAFFRSYLIINTIKNFNNMNVLKKYVNNWRHDYDLVKKMVYTHMSNYIYICRTRNCYKNFPRKRENVVNKWLFITIKLFSKKISRGSFLR